MVFFSGNGNSFGVAQSNGFTNTQVFTGIRWTFENNSISIANRNGTTWANDITSTSFPKNTELKVVIIGNNSSAAVTYADSQTVNAYTYDIYVNGVLVGDNISKAGLGNASSINAFRFYSENSSNNTAIISLDNIMWYNSARLPLVTWNGATWTGGIPNQAINANIDANYSASSFSANNITVQNNSTLEITSGNTVNANNITIENGANLIERDGGALVLATNGTATVKKTGTTAADKYVFWASPVASQNLANIYGGSNMPAFITEYNTANNTFVTAPSANACIAGKGYSVKNPVANAAITFAGAPNTGNLTYTLNNSSFKYNLVGNPYPSDINLTQLYAGNSTNISSTMYFWDSTSTAQGNNPGYATVNTAGTGATWTAAPNSSILPAGNVAKVGQGFIVKSLGTDTVNGTPLTFTNAMRAGESATFFNKNTAAGNEGKFWLRLSSSYNTNNTIAVTYSALASDAYDAYDSKAMGLGTNALYSAVEGEKVVIQGKAAFHVYDVVALGTKHQNAGSFTIELLEKEGIFDNGQAIYLHDKELNTYTNLQNQNYTFSASAGEWSDRFEIVYITSLLATQEAQNAALEIYRDGEQFVIRNSKKMEHIEVFEMSGRKIQDLTPNTTLATIKLDAKGIYIVKVKSSGKELVKKISK